MAGSADRNPFDAIQRIVDEELARIERSGSANDPPQRPLRANELARAIKDAVQTFARAVRFEIRVPGTHYSGLSNDDLFEILREQGRDFLDPTSVALKQRMQRELLSAFAGFPRVPTLEELRREHTKQVKLFIANERFAKGGGDQNLTKLTAAYAKWKRKTVGSRPIGVLHGKLLAAFRKNAELVYR